MSTLATDIMWLAICIYHEARGESAEGRIAVGHVILNRTKATGKPVKDVILRPYQFSWANGGARPPITDYEALAHCFEAVESCMSSRAMGETLSGADHYFADYIQKPKWAEGMTKIQKIGKHTFYRS